MKESVVKQRKCRLRSSWKHALDVLVFPVRYLAALHGRRRYSSILTLGHNCELAFRSWTVWGGLDSCVFSWANTLSLDKLLDGLSNFRDIGVEWKENLSNGGQHICAITGFRFHGKATNDVLFRGGVPDRVAVAEDRRELTSRLDYLKRKFVRLLSDRERSLVVYKIKTSDCVPGVSEKVERLRKCLDGFGGCYDLLIVCERGNESVFGDDPGFELRCVDRFNPDSDVTNARLGDPLGWRLLFTEFAPRVTVKRKDKKFKFQ